MPESVIDLSEGIRSSSEDWAGLNDTVINWTSDQFGASRPRPGITANAALITGNTSLNQSPFAQAVIGVYVWKSVVDAQFYLVHVLADRTIWAKSFSTGILYALSVADPLSKLDGSATQVSFTEDSQRLIMAGGGQLQIWTGNILSATSRISVFALGVNQPPLKATHVVNIANYIVSHDLFQPNTANTIRWSNLGDGVHTTWNPANFNTADADPDSVVAVGSVLREVFAFGAKTVQVFGVTADPALPFASSASLRIGCIAPYSVITLDSNFAWLDDQRRFIISDGRTYEWIGEDIYKEVGDLGTVSDCWGFRIRLGFWDLLVWIFPTEGRAFVFNQRKKDWREWRGWNGVDDYAAIRISSYVTFPEQNLHIVGDPVFSNIWNLSLDETTDTGPGLPIVCEKITRATDYGNGARKRSKRVRFFVKRGQSAVADSEPAGLDVAVSDDGKEFRGQSRIDLGTAGDYSNYKDWYPGGIFRKRQFRIRYSGSVDMSMTMASDMWDSYGEEGA